jgi:peroxiredoxin family protein
MLPGGTRQLKLSRMHMAGAGTAMIRRRMKDKNFAGCEELLEAARDLGVRILVCDMSMDLLGMRMDDLIDYPGLAPCGVSTFVARAMESKVTLFI